MEVTFFTSFKLTFLKTYQADGGKISPETEFCIYNDLAFCYQHQEEKLATIDFL